MIKNSKTTGFPVVFFFSESIKQKFKSIVSKYSI